MNQDRDKRKYEEHLFKNRNNLFNLITYIEHARKKGLKGNEISKKLKKSGWNSEQIAYALKKHAGKRTGMAEIPIKFRFGKKKPNQMPPSRMSPPGFDPKKPFKKF